MVAELLRVPLLGTRICVCIFPLEGVDAFTAWPGRTGSIIWCRIDSDGGEEDQQREGDDGLEVHLGW